MTAEIVQHRSTERAPADRGAGLGREQAARIAATWDVYQRLFALEGLGAGDVHRLGIQALEQIHAWAPKLGEEIEGIAAGSGVAIERVAALNARTELLAAGAASAKECSTIAVLGPVTTHGRPIGVQTWDWHEELASSWLVWEIEHADGRVVRTLTEAGIVGKIGVSSAGVAVHLNILGHRLDRAEIGVPVHIACRRVLDEADGPVAALTLLSTADVSASSAVTVVADDEDGGVACTVELSPAGPGFVTPDTRGVLVHTNHFLRDPGRAGDRLLPEAPDTVLRLELASRRMARLAEGEIDAEAILEALRSHRGGSGAICCHPAESAAFGDRWTTLATIVTDPAEGAMRVLRGGPCGHTAAAAARHVTTDL